MTEIANKLELTKNPDNSVAFIEHEVKDGDRASLLEWYDKVKNTKNGFGTSNYFLKIKNIAGKINYEEHVGRACHSSFLSGTQSLVGVVNLWGYDDDSEQASLFKDWFVNRSYYSKFILNKDDYKEGIVTSGDINAVLMHHANICARSLSEMGQTFLRSWYHWMEKGFTEDIAFFLSKAVHRDSMSGSVYASYSHQSPFGWPKVQAAVNFLRQEVVDFEGMSCPDNYKSACTPSNETPSVFGTSRTGTGRFINDLKSLEVRTSKESPITNPFTQKRETGLATISEEFFTEVMLQLQKEFV